MIEAVSRPLLRLLRVPPEPRLPAGAPGTARVFRAAPNYWNLKLLGWGIQQGVTLVGFVVLMTMMQVASVGVESVRQVGPQVRRVDPRWRRVTPPPFLADIPLAGLEILEAIALGVWLVQLPLTFSLLRLDYELRWYIVTDRAARLREGIMTLREMTFTLANVQDIRIRQGPLQRLFGLADVELRTAGGGEAPVGQAGRGAEARNLHLARFRGVANANMIRDLVVDRMKKARGAGLGDPDDVVGPVAAAPAAPAAVPDTLASAARELAEESARLRRVVCP